MICKILRNVKIGRKTTSPTTALWANDGTHSTWEVYFLWILKWRDKIFERLWQFLEGRWAIGGRKNPRHIPVNTSNSNTFDRIQIIFLYLISFSFHFEKLLLLLSIKWQGQSWWGWYVKSVLNSSLPAGIRYYVAAADGELVPFHLRPPAALIRLSPCHYFRHTEQRRLWQH